MDSYVVDASVTLAWCFEDERTPFVLAAQEALRTNSVALVPEIWPTEVANGIRTATRHGRLTLAESELFIALLLRLPIRIASGPPAQTFRRVLPLALAQGLTVYDAAYLDLAIRMKLLLATLDQSLREAANRLGVNLLGGN